VRFQAFVGVVAAFTTAVVIAGGPVAYAEPDWTAQGTARGLPPAPAGPTGPVEAPELTTEEKIVHRQPDGKYVAELSVEPVRVKRDGRWVPVDTNLVRRPDGSIAPRAVPAELTFSPGGSDTPLVRLANGGKAVALTWPGRLPAPTIDGAVATYREVLPGVDLVMRAEAKGYAQRLVIKNVRAAKDPALARIKFGLSTTGVTVKAAASGALTATDAADGPVFEAPPPSMWDSPSTSSGTGRRQAPVKAELTPQALTLVPNANLLTDPTTQFPIMIDPDWKTFSKSGWTKVFSGYPNQSYWNGANDVDTWAKVGYCGWAFCNGIGITRAFFQFDTSSLSGTILKANLNTTVVYSPSCSYTSPHQVYRASGSINSSTTWNTRPSGTVRGHEKVPACGQVWVLAGGQVKVLIPRFVVSTGGCGPGR